MEPTKSHSTRHLTKDRSFLDKASIFDFRTMVAFDTIREPVNTFRKFEGFINRMPSHKSPGFKRIPVELFKQAPKPFQRRIHLLFPLSIHIGRLCRISQICSFQVLRLSWISWQLLETLEQAQTLNPKRAATTAVVSAHKGSVHEKGIETLSDKVFIQC